MRSRGRARGAAWALTIAVALLAGCGSPPAPSPGSPAGTSTAPPSEPATPAQVGAADSVNAAPGSPDAKYGYRFRQTMPGSDTFTFYDRDVSFYFRPAPDALHFQLENKQNRVIWIDWDKTQMLSPDGTTSKPAHASASYRDRFSVQTPTQVSALQRYSDYVFPIDYLIDPGNSDQQLHRPLFPEDETAPNYSGREFGVDLALRVDNQPRTYSFRFKVVSVLPR